MKTRPFHVACLLAAIIASIVGIFWFLPATFEVRDYAGTPVVSYKGHPVRRVGYSRLSQMANADGKNRAGPLYFGRCYVDYVDGTKVKRTYGSSVWFCAHFEDILDKTGKPIRVNFLRTTIDLR